MESLTDRQMVLDELASYLIGIRGPASELDRRKHSKVFEACAALRLELRLWSQISTEVLKPKHPHHGRGGYRDMGVDCASPDLSHCAQAKWYAPGAYIKFADASTFYTYACAILRAETLTIVHSEGVRVSPIVQEIPGITFLTVLNKEIDAYADEARKHGDPSRALKRKSPGGPVKKKEPDDGFVIVADSGGRGDAPKPQETKAPAPEEPGDLPPPPRRTIGSVLWSILGTLTGGRAPCAAKDGR